MKLRNTAADKWFSLYIRHRDDYTCQRCGAQYSHSENMLDCSHFHSRAKRSVRFDPDNAVTLCKKCHMFFDGHTSWGIQPNKAAHDSFMLKRLGPKRYDQLLVRAHLPSRIDEKETAKHYQTLVQALKEKRMSGKVT